MSQLEINAPNRWRLETPGHAGWSRTARPDDPNKYFIVSADCHANEPSNLWAERIDAKYRDRLPRVTTDANGVIHTNPGQPPGFTTQNMHGALKARLIAPDRSTLVPLIRHSTASITNPIKH